MRSYDAIRRAVDVVVSAAALVVLAPLLLLIAVAVKLDSPGPVFYVQRRVGRTRSRRHDNVLRLDGWRDDVYGGLFDMYKFRTMKQNAEALTGAVWCEEQDPRITRVGRILRQTHLDELPQLWNVIKGDMALIGPRPERPEFVRGFAREIAGYCDRHQVLPGITGWAQVCRGYDGSIEDVREKLRYDLEYIERRSPAMDAIICARTVLVMITGDKGAH